MTFRSLQEQAYKWARRNFGEDSPPYEPLLGIVEEVGELSHAHLKGRQGIRHTPEEILARKKDAVADIIIYLADYCSRSGIDLQDAVEETWRMVRERDWKRDPAGGDKDLSNEEIERLLDEGRNDMTIEHKTGGGSRN